MTMSSLDVGRQSPRDPYGALFRQMMLPAWERLRRRPTLEHLADLERSQWWSLDRLLARQVEDLRALLRHARANVPFYRARMDAAGVSPDDIRDVADIRKLPLLCRDVARAAGRTWQSTAPPLAVIRKSTGGTTGDPLVFGYDLGSEWWRQAMKLRGYAWSGYRPGDRTVHYWGRPLAAPPPWQTRTKIALDRLFRRDYYLDCTRADLPGAVEFIKREKPQLIVCYTLAGAALARYVVDNGLRSWGTIPVICAAEKLYEVDRQALIQAFGPAVFDTYGSREVMLIAAECSAHDGLHVSMENLLVEIIVREGGRERPALPGEEGDVVITDLHNYGMPFIRYLNGDRAVAASPDRCACGRALVRLKSIEGRQADLLRDTAGRPVSGILFSVMFSYPPMSERVCGWQAIQHKDGSVTVKLVPNARFTEADQRKVAADVSERLCGQRVEVELVREIAPCHNGKRRVVIVES